MSSCVQCQHGWLLAEQITERALKLQMEEWKGLGLTCPPLVCWEQQDPVFAVAAPVSDGAWGRLCLELRGSLAALLHPLICWVAQALCACPNHAFIHSSSGALAVGLECSTRASISSISAFSFPL